MTNENIERMKRHLGRGVVMELGGDKFEIPPLTIKNLPEFYEVSAKLSDGNLSNLTKETIEEIYYLIKETCKSSKDIDCSDEKMLDEFIVSNFMDLMLCMMEANMATVSDSTTARLEAMNAKYGRVPANNTAK